MARTGIETGFLLDQTTLAIDLAVLTRADIPRAQLESPMPQALLEAFPELASELSAEERARMDDLPE